MVSRPVRSSATPGALAAAGVPDETITVVLRLVDMFSRDWDRATMSMDAGMRRVEGGLNRFQHHAYQLEGLASRYMRARTDIAQAEEQATDRMVRSLRRAEAAVQSYDRIISGRTDLRGQQRAVSTRARQDTEALLSRAAYLESELARVRTAQPVAAQRVGQLEGRIAGSSNLNLGMGHEDALFGMHQLREARRQSQVYRSQLADIEKFQQATLRQSGIIEERVRNTAENRGRMESGIRTMRGADFRSAATVASYRSTFPEAARLIEEMGPDLARHYFSRDLEFGEHFPEPKTSTPEQRQAMRRFDRHQTALTMAQRAPNRVLYPGDRQLGADPGLDYGPIPGGPARVRQGEGLRFRLDKPPESYTIESHRNYVREAEPNLSLIHISEPTRPY